MTRAPRTRTLPALVAAGLAVLGVVASGCGGGSSSDAGATAATTTAAASRSATLILDWFPNADHAGIYSGLLRKLFEDQGIKLTPKVPSDPAASLKQVAAGRAQFALSYEPEVLIARSEGIPVKAIGALVTAPLNAILARADRGIARPRDLEGKTVGIAGVPSDRPLLDEVVRADGGDPSKVKVRTIGFTLEPALAAGKVDATIGSYWNVEAVDLRKKKVPLNVFRLEKHGVPTYDELVVVTSDKVAKEDPTLVKGFMRALQRGQMWAVANQKDSVAALVKANPDLDPALTATSLQLVAPLLTPTNVLPLSLSTAAWRRFAAWMTANKLLSKPVDVSAAVTERFVPRTE
jgi:putative hydroxymethylpyrimidine transport system substrate-binding protein